MRTKWLTAYITYVTTIVHINTLYNSCYNR